MSILFSLVSRGSVVLARYAICAGNFSEVTEQILGKICASQAPHMTYSHASYLFNFITENGVIYLCITDNELNRENAFCFLEDIKARFLAQYESQVVSSLPYAMNSSFAPILASQMKHHSDRRDFDKIAKLQTEVSDVQEVLVQSIESLANRGEKLELLINKTENLNSSSVTFRTTSRAIVRNLWWKNVRFIVYIILGLAVSIYIVGAMACGLSWKACTS